jgi:hypothetical protein
MPARRLTLLAKRPILTKSPRCVVTVRCRDGLIFQCSVGAVVAEIGPLTLGLNAEMVAGLLEGGLQGPAMDVSSQNGGRPGVEIGAQEGLWLAGASGVAHQHPSDRQRRHSAMIPDGGCAGEFEAAALSAVPFRHDDFGPDRGRVCENLGELLQLVAPLGGPARPSGSARGRRREQIGIKPQAGDEPDMAADGGDQFDGGEAGIGDDDDEPVGSQRLIWRMPCRAQSVRAL